MKERRIDICTIDGSQRQRVAFEERKELLFPIPCQLLICLLLYSSIKYKLASWAFYNEWYIQPLMLLVLMLLVLILSPRALSPRTLSPDGLSENVLSGKKKSGASPIRFP